MITAENLSDELIRAYRREASELLELCEEALLRPSETPTPRVVERARLARGKIVDIINARLAL
jgi:hypothetical protein